MRFNHLGVPRTMGIIIAVCLPIITASTLSLAQDDSKPVVTAGKQFKNIKVLKDLPANQLIPVMHKFNDALGVKCDACHVIGPNHTGFEKDDKEMKLRAREMLLMVQDINKNQKTLHGSATCYMCHHGSPEPQRMPPPPAPAPAPDAKPPQR
jgi:hypothetical protein